MKLKKLFLASLAICTLASCSKEDIPSGPQEMDAYISIAAIAETTTKAGTTTGTEKETVVHTLTAMVFDTDGNFITRKDSIAVDDDPSISEIKDIKVKVAAENGEVSTTFQVYLFANIEVPAVITIEKLKAAALPTDITTFTKIGEHYLPMHSGALVIKGLQAYESGTTPVTNWYVNNDETTTTQEDAKSVVMTRSISRVEIVSLATKFDASLKDATFTVKKIYVANVRATATLLGEVDEEAAFYRGGPTKFDVFQGLIDTTGSGVKADNYLTEYNNGIVLGKDPNMDSFSSFKKYIYANTISSKYQTRLIIEGEYKAFGSAKTKYFHIPLKDDEVKVGEVYENVVTNKIYQITAVITGEGSDNPDEILKNAMINFSIKVAPWRVVTQTEEDTN